MISAFCSVQVVKKHSTATIIATCKKRNGVLHDDTDLARNLHNGNFPNLSAIGYKMNAQKAIGGSKASREEPSICQSDGDGGHATESTDIKCHTNLAVETQDESNECGVGQRASGSGSVVTLE
jgi:hypothetical protein